MAKEPKVSALDRAIQLAMGDDRTFGLADDPAKETMPGLWEFLTTIYVGRDKMKQPALLQLQAVPGGISCKLTDRDLRQSLGVIVPYFASALESLERIVSGPNPPWVQWGKGEPELRKRKARN